jgi:hypothetical protein
VLEQAGLGRVRAGVVACGEHVGALRIGEAGRVRNVAAGRVLRSG